ncbi:DUF2950 domain-containing protein [Geomonas sp. Red32]|uniref:DUF2950 domain-containing protein n=1 Tax=Geomonas sp. Red32 TaxID=2912856 RepID=UPI00202CD4F3|nr:DUF2950 domain-containing protein [Geomonas sp. Red32]MCM0081404.1 DUF2950 domain-containing protein [Geomonas sp. Red32]
MRTTDFIVKVSLGLLVAVALLTAVPSLKGEPMAAGTEAAQLTFPTPEAASQAMVDAVKEKDRQRLARIFGPAFKDLEPGDPVEEAAEFDHFASHVAEGVQLVKEGDGKATLQIGSEKWPFPIPVVKKNGVWAFDTTAGREEILNRRIGHNELLAINVCRSYVDAQKEYYNMPDQGGAPIPKYAQHMISRPGTRNGLYWPTAPGMKQSPLGPLVAKAKEEGYMAPRKPGEHGRRPFHGYYFRILKKQEKSAPGGKFSYVINGNMVAGHALVAYPSRWGVSGVMTFIVNQSGRVYQKNLGPKTADIARKMTAYNPDPSWKLVAP